MRKNRTIYMDTIYTHEPDNSCHGKYLQERPVKLRFNEVLWKRAEQMARDGETPGQYSITELTRAAKSE